MVTIVDVNTTSWVRQPDSPFLDGSRPTNARPSGLVTISGTTTEGQLLTANNTLTDPDGLGTLSYQWINNISGNIGTNSSTYTLQASDVGNTITVTISYTDGSSQVESKTSDPTATISGIGTGNGHGLTATHYCSSTGTEAYATATSDTSPCSPTAAMQNAAAGDVVEFAPGSYSFTDTGNALTPCFRPWNDGTSLNPITFVAKYPAANNTNSSLYTTFKRPGATPSSPIFGAGGNGAYRSYITYDGIHVDHAQDGYPSTRGICYFGNDLTSSNNNTIRRCRFDQIDLGAYGDIDNLNCVHIHGCTDVKVQDNHFLGGHRTGMGHNEACVLTYGGDNTTIEHNTFEDVICGIYIKGSYGSLSNDGNIRFNKFSGSGFSAMELAAVVNGGQLNVYQNLLIDNISNAEGMTFDSGAAGLEMYDTAFYNNTIVSDTTAQNGLIFMEANPYVRCEVRDNIVVYVANGITQTIVNAWNETDLSTMTAFDYNWYWNNGNNTAYAYNATLYDGATAFTDWKAALPSSFDANSNEGDPNFTNIGTGDYTIASGSALTASSTAGPVGCYITGSEEIGKRASPTY